MWSIVIERIRTSSPLCATFFYVLQSSTITDLDIQLIVMNKIGITISFCMLSISSFFVAVLLHEAFVMFSSAWFSYLVSI
jgi:hypothetical protein